MSTKPGRKNDPISLPCLRGSMGDWIYYVALFSLVEIRNRVFQPEEIDKKYASDELRLGDWIQRKIEHRRIAQIVTYLENQEQRFFNSLVLGIYGGSPSWQEISFSSNQIFETIDEDVLNSFEKTFGILTLSGLEDIFPIDGQHRAMGIRKAVDSSPNLSFEEVPVIFIAHKTDTEGVIRTRRLFSTLNRYAKPVNKSEIIALSEDNNCSIIVRQLIDEYTPLLNKILINKNRSINPDNTWAFTNILTLYDVVETTLTNKKVYGISVTGRDHIKFTTSRETEQVIASDSKKVFDLMDRLIREIPSLALFIRSGKINRKGKNGSLIFKPIGQNILFNVLKISESKGILDQAIKYFSKDDFTLEHKVWRQIFWDSETANIITEKSRQKYAALLILDKIGCNPSRTKKDLEMHENFGISLSDL